MEYFVISLDLPAHLAHLHKVNDLVLIVSATLGELCQPDLLAISRNICQERRGEERQGSSTSGAASSVCSSRRQHLLHSRELPGSQSCSPEPHRPGGTTILTDLVDQGNVYLKERIEPVGVSARWSRTDQSLPRVQVLELQPGAGRHLGGDVGLVRVVGLVEAEDDVVLVRHGVVDVVMPGSVLLVISPHHGDKYLVGWRGPTGPCGAATVVLGWSLLVVGSDVPVIPPTIQALYVIMFPRISLLHTPPTSRC